MRSLSINIIVPSLNSRLILSNKSIFLLVLRSELEATLGVDEK